MNRKIPASLGGLVFAAALLASAAPALAATINVASDPVKGGYESAVLKAADRLITLQNSNGSWDWAVTNATGPTANTYLNVTGVSAEALLDAYSITQDSKYLTAAKKAGDYLVSGLSTASTTRQNGFNVVFLQHLGNTTGDATYINAATTFLTTILHGENYWSHNYGSHCTVSGCTPDELLAAYEVYRGVPGSPSQWGIVPWDLTSYVDAAQASGDTSTALGIEQQIAAYVATSTYADTIGSYHLGLAAAIRAAKLVGDTTNAAAFAAKLDATQNSDGSFGTASDGQVQTTAYALMALNLMNDGHAAAAASYLGSKFGYSSINGWLETDSNEYAEVDSEASHALAALLPSDTFYSIQDAINAASTTAADIINVGAGTYKESDIVIDRPVSIIGSGQGSTFIAPAIIGASQTAASLSGHDAFRLDADNVTIENLTIDGNLNGGHLDFHNGIVQDSATTNNLTLQNVTIQNVWWRGVNMRGDLGGGTGHVFDHLTVNNVSGLPAGDTNREQNIGVVFFGTSTAEVKNSSFNNVGTGLATGGEPVNTINWHDNTVTNADEMAYEPLVVGPGSVFTNNTATFSTPGHSVGIEPGYSTVLNITNSKITGAQFGARVEVQTTPNVIGDLVFGQGTVFTGPGAGVAGSVGILGKDKDTNGGAVTSFTIDGATITGYETGVTASLTSGGPSTIIVKNTALSGNATNVASTTNTAFTITDNYWGATDPTDIAAKLSGFNDLPAAFTPWYINPGRTVLNTSLDHSGDITVPSGSFDFTETSDGGVELPSGSTNLVLSDSSTLDFSSSANTASGGNVTVGGNSIPLSNFTSGDLAGVNLSTSQEVGDQSVTVDKAVKLSSGTSGQPVVLVNADVSGATLAIPDGTTILAPSGWTGSMQPPKIGDTSGTAPSGFSVGRDSAIDVGDPNQVLLFDKPVTVFLKGVGGTVGYKPAGSSEWKQITAVCDGTYDSPTMPASVAFPGECAISGGDGTKILTYHLTTFGALNTVTPTSASSGGGSGGGGGGGVIGLIGQVSNGYGGTVSASAAPAASAASSAAAGTAPASSAQGGEVLGAAVYNFAKPLSVGSRGADVEALQNILIAGGFLKASATGYFGPLTKAAVQAYQKANGLPMVGNVGPLTRALLNKGTAPTTPESVPQATSTSSTSNAAAAATASGASDFELRQALQAQINAVKAEIEALIAKQKAGSTSH